MKSICLINGSLRGKQAASLQFLQDIGQRLPDSNFQKTIITVQASVRTEYPKEAFNSMAKADAIVLVFPLFTYGLPGALMRLLEDYFRYLMDGKPYNRNASVYAIINCAYPRPEITTKEAIRVIRNFCIRLSLHWRMAICIGTGPVVMMTRNIPFLYPQLRKGYRQIAFDILDKKQTPLNNCFIRPVIPESIIAAIKRRYEKKGHMYE